MTVEDHSLPVGDAPLRRAMYSGAVWRLPPSPASRALVNTAVETLTSEFGSLERAQREHEFDDAPGFLAKLGAMGTRLRDLDAALHLVDGLLKDLGLSPLDYAADAVRLRGVRHNGHLHPDAAAAYSAHRDTWYANPQCQINFWLPLTDVTAEQTFCFYPHRFAAPVPNDSGAFDYLRFAEDAGWQARKNGAAIYPTTPIGLEAEPHWPVECSGGEIICFSGAHLHRSQHNASGRCRYSIDFRVVHLGDHAKGIGAPNVDNRSVGDALCDYRRAPQ